MESEMIIYCKAQSAWMRARDKLLYCVSILLWVALLSVLLRLEAQEILKFISSFYLAMVFSVAGLLFGWSRYRKSIFRIITRKYNRRTRYTALSQSTTAKYFFIEEGQLCVLQKEKGAIIQHGNDSYLPSMLFHNHSLLQSASFKKKMARYHAAA